MVNPLAMNHSVWTLLGPGYSPRSKTTDYPLDLPPVTQQSLSSNFTVH